MSRRAYSVTESRRSVYRLVNDARAAGHTVEDPEPKFDAWAEEYHLMFDITDNQGELFEAYFKRSDNGYWRFDHGFRHVGTAGTVTARIRFSQRLLSAT